MFNFATSDTVNILKMRIMYKYNASHNCRYNGTLRNSIINATCTKYVCKNPIMLINNMGQANLTNLIVDIDVLNESALFKYGNSEYIQFAYEEFEKQYLFIWNRNIMNITNAYIANTISSIFICNDKQLSISNISTNKQLNSTKPYNPNALHSKVIILSRFDLVLHNATLIGSQYSLGLSGDSAVITNSSIQDTSAALTAVNINKFIMKYSEIKMPIGF